MRDDSYLESEVEAVEAPPKWRSRATTAIGALLSVAILAGVVIWSYKLGVRDAAEIPVIRAELGATKEKPEEPGGLEVDYQGRSVYGAVTGDAESVGTTGFAEPAATLAEEDVAPVAVSPAPTPRPAEPVIASPEPIQREPEPVAEAPAPAAPPAETELVTPAAPEPVAEAAAEEAATEEEVAVIDDNSLAPARAPVAPPRPVRQAAAPAAEAIAEPRAAALASQVQIQLGAFVSQEVANEQWAAIKARNGDLLAGRGRVVTPVLSGGRRLWRLRAGPFADVTEASTLCRSLKARNEACIVARNEN